VVFWHSGSALVSPSTPTQPGHPSVGISKLNTGDNHEKKGRILLTSVHYAHLKGQIK